MNIRKVIQISLIALIGLQGCASQMQRMQEHLAVQVREAPGLSLHQARLPGGIIARRDPTELRMLSNGHVLYVYHDYWANSSATAMPCDVLLEVNPKGQTIVNARASGKGCYNYR
jgi:hypothetical protein